MVLALCRCGLAGAICPRLLVVNEARKNEKPHRGAAFLLGKNLLWYAGWLYPAEPIGNQDQDKQHDGKSYAECQCLYRPIPLPFIPHEKDQRRPQTRKNQDKSDGYQYLHMNSFFETTL